MPADSPSSPSPKEKAFDWGPAINVIRTSGAPALAAQAVEALWAKEAALRASEASVAEHAEWTAVYAKRAVEAEASVESLRKERDDARHIVKLLEQSVDNVIRQREAAHAEATKAEHDRALNWAADFAANHSCDEHCECSDFIAADLRVAAGKYREPSSPTPPTSPRKEVVEWCGATCERSERSCLEAPYRCRGLKGHGGSHWTGNGVFWSSPEPEPNYASPTPPTSPPHTWVSAGVDVEHYEPLWRCSWCQYVTAAPAIANSERTCVRPEPTPPSEGPMEEESGPCCEDHYADRCNHGIYPKENCWNCFPSPEPPREEPRE